MTAQGGPAPRAILDGRYELDARLVDWGLGDAWRARDGNFDQRTVVVKLLAPLASDDAELSANFTQQARNLRSLRHANVLPVVNHGLWERQPYVVTDLVSGTSLGKGLQDARTLGERLPIALVDQLFGLMCAGVAAAHEALRPIVHGGLNPASVRIERASGGKFDVRVLDFGLAAMLPGGPAGSPLVRPYVPPEVLAGEESTPAGDVRALGMLLVEMLTAGPSKGDADRANPLLDVIAKDGHGIPTAVHGLRDDVSPAVWEVVARAVHHTAALRFASAGALRDALKKALTTPRVRTATAPAQAIRLPPIAPTPAAPAAAPANAPPPLTDAPLARSAPGTVSVVSAPAMPGASTVGPSLIAAPSPTNAPLALGVLPTMSAPELVGPAPRMIERHEAPPERDEWEQLTDISRPIHPSDLPAEVEESTHFFEVPPPEPMEATGVLMTQGADPGQDLDRTASQYESDDAYDLRSTTPALKAVPYAIPTGIQAADPGAREVSHPPENSYSSEVLRAFDNVGGRVDAHDDWTASHRRLESTGAPGLPQRAPGTPPGAGIPQQTAMAPVSASAWDRVSQASVQQAPQTETPRRSVLPWVVAAVLMLLSLGIAAAVLLIH